jgi:hypothetical protein
MKQPNNTEAEGVSLDVWQDIDSNGEHSIQGNVAGLEALLAAITTVLEKKGAITVGVNTKDGRVTVELAEKPAA